ncbi:MAG: hypothetical protein Q8J96_05450 [Rhodocyclaceae bacterium]|nr:hypothetical protein [Rhodocyclaceae bacterium]
MKTLLGMAVGTVTLLATDVALAQNGNMMSGGSSGAGWMHGYGGYGIGGPILLIVVVALVVWIVRRSGK